MKLMHHLVWMLGLSVCASTLSCSGESSGSNEPAVPGKRAKSALERETSPDVPTGDQAILSTGNTAFALDLLREITKSEDGNVFVSPYSVSSALGMTFAGARGNTESQMADTLHYELSQDRLHPAFNWLDLELGKRGEGAKGADGGKFRLKIANAVFGQDGYSFESDYLDTLSLNYGAGLSLLDFAGDPDGSREEINDWVGVATENKIPELLPSNIIKPTTRLVLTNAVYFNASWKEPFPKESTTEGVFHAPTGDVKAPLMNHRYDYGYVEGAGYQAVSIPYDGDELDFVILLPDEGTIDSFTAGLDATTLEGIFDTLAPSDIELIMPKFEFRFKSRLDELFSAMGMTDAFDSALADFSGIDGKSCKADPACLFIQAIVHEAYINLAEFGTEASGATAVIIGTDSAPAPVRVDRPFLFLVRDIATGTILFLGRVTDPS